MGTITANTRGLRMIAAFEAAKGLLVVAAGFGVLALLHRDLQAMAAELVRHFHLNPARHYAQIFVVLAGRVTDGEIWMLALGAAAYAGLRLAEAYGLWHARPWAIWLGALSGAIYVPIELYELLEKASLLKLALLAVNVAIVVYLGRRLWRRRAAS
jgi:uncharacterized membrane protein (DUF2068 family)